MGYNPGLGGLKSFLVIQKLKHIRFVVVVFFVLCKLFLHNFVGFCFLFFKLGFFFIIGELYWFGYDVPFKICLCCVIYVTTMMFVPTNIGTHNKVLNGWHIGWCYIT
jgi:hypothetical protein